MSMHFYKKAFTLVELLVAIAIFTIMTAILVMKYGGFSEGMTLTNLAYDIALTLREAQSYGINVTDAGNQTGRQGQFNYAYGLYFTTAKLTQFRLYGDYDENGRRTDGSEDIRVMNTTRGNKIEFLCVRRGSGACASVAQAGVVDIQFKRPDPTPIISAGANSNSLTSGWDIAEIRVLSPNGSHRRVVVRTSGQISVEDTAGLTQDR